MPHLVDGLHTMLINGIIIHISECIEFNFDWALNTVEFSIRVTFCYFFVYTENESKCKWRTLKVQGVDMTEKSGKKPGNFLLRARSQYVTEALYSVSHALKGEL